MKMKRFLFLLAASCVAFGCGKAAARDESNLVNLEKTPEEREKTNKYLLRGTAQWDRELDMRMSLMPAPVNKVFLALSDIDGKSYLGLTTKSHFIDGTYDYMEEGSFIKFKIGSLYETYYAEILDFQSGRPVGKISYNSPASDYPNTPRLVYDICTQAYEDVCTLSYEKEIDQFVIKLH